MKNKFVRMIMLMLVMIVSISALAACGNNRNPEGGTATIPSFWSHLQN
ncbi:hypothetical protein [Bacillus paranthracis]|nr:hypothetical protein [Bacillus paranthracis]MDF9581243.1 hypothetical protein [Bacillus paranthracis]MDG1616492.1 hypothetical protein [Bacillus paranthracis]